MQILCNRSLKKYIKTIIPKNSDWNKIFATLWNGFNRADFLKTQGLSK